MRRFKRSKNGCDRNITAGFFILWAIFARKKGKEAFIMYLPIQFNNSFAQDINRSGLEDMFKKGYKVKEIAAIYDVGVATVYTALHALYGCEWKKTIAAKTVVAA